MRISDWSSDVCSSDLLAIRVRTKLDTDANLVIRTFGLSRTKLVASPSLLDARGRPSTPGELSHLPALSMREHEGTQRSEEHTPELQSLMRISYAVFCLKKKKNKNIQNVNNISLHKPC